MPAYWVARSRITDPVEYKKYADLVPGIIAKFGGKVPSVPIPKFAKACGGLVANFGIEGH